MAERPGGPAGRLFKVHTRGAQTGGSAKTRNVSDGERRVERIERRGRVTSAASESWNGS
jgi:hypothetical protein